VIPSFNPANPDHLEVASPASQLAALARSIAADDDKTGNPIEPIASRRRRLRSKLKQLREYHALEEACSAVLEAVA
jgi:hypothetical protein